MKRLVAAFLLCGLIAGDVTAESKPSSRPSTSSSRPSTSSSRPSTSTSRPSTPSSRPSTSTPSSRPSTSTPSTRPTAPSIKTPAPSVPKVPSIKFDGSASTSKKIENSSNIFNSNNGTKTTPPQPKTNSLPIQSDPPPTASPSFRPNSPTQSTTPNNPKTPSITFDNSAANSKKIEQSRNVFSKSTPAAPQTSDNRRYVTIDNERYNNRTQRIDSYYRERYPQYEVYRSRPVIDVGGGYSSLFWYSMLEWDLNRRATWLYHHQNSINQNLYEQELLKNAALRAEVERLKSSGVAVNSSYVDPEFVGNEDLMLNDTHVKKPTNLSPLFWALGGITLTGLLVYFVFIKKYGDSEIANG